MPRLAKRRNDDNAGNRVSEMHRWFAALDEFRDGAYSHGEILFKGLRKPGIKLFKNHANGKSASVDDVLKEAEDRVEEYLAKAFGLIRPNLPEGVRAIVRGLIGTSDSEQDWGHCE